MVDTTTISVPVWLWQKIRNYQTEWRNPTLGDTIVRIFMEWEKSSQNGSNEQIEASGGGNGI